MKRLFTILIIVVCMASCERFVDLGTPKTQIVTGKVFDNDIGARAAISGIFSQFMASSAFASGGLAGITTIAGLSADELNNHSTTASRVAIYNNDLTPITTVSSLWTEMYLAIYEANAILEGIDASHGVTAKVKDQVTGEALFIRAFAYFYLVNFYGDVPLLLTTDYRVNRQASRTLVADVYHQIEEDLLKAQRLLLVDYSFSNNEKVEPNSWAATAMLARVYLFQGKWADAEVQATAVIDSERFSLATDLNSVFVANSDEAIWQLMPVLPRMNTFDGPYFLGEYNVVDVSLTASLVSSFEADDNRSSSWVGISNNGDLTYNYGYKYKVLFADQPLTEYQMVLRLAEQYLIRAEARAMLNDLEKAVEDINLLRARAGLAPVDATGLTQQQMMDIIEHERRVELFVEWGHRWFDLKRWGRSDAVLGPVKPNWQPTDVLFPIPQSEINSNPNLTQNP